MLLRLPFLAIGALGAPVMVALALAIVLAEVRTGLPISRGFVGLGGCGFAVMAVLWLIRWRDTPRPGATFLDRAGRVVPLLMIPGAIGGVVLGAIVHVDLVAEERARRAAFARSVCHGLRITDPRCVEVAPPCLPVRPSAWIEIEDHRACIEARLAR